MKKHISVFGLFLQSSLLPILGIILLMGATELLFFHREIQSALTAYEADIGTGFVPLERMLDKSAVNVWFALAFVLITVLLCLPGCEFRIKTGYTLRRLSVGDNAILLWQFLYNTLIYLLLGAVQTIFAYGLCQYYLAAAPQEMISNQTLFLTFYRSELLHTLLPLSDILLWVRNLLLALSLGLAAAMFPYKQRHGRYSGSIIALVAFGIVFFERRIGTFSHTAVVACICLMVACEWVSFALTQNHEEVEEDA